MSSKDTGRCVSPPFMNDKDITYGVGRVIWADGGLKYGEGWVLPGGAVTQNEAVAFDMAVTIDAITKRRNHP